MPLIQKFEIQKLIEYLSQLSQFERHRWQLWQINWLSFPHQNFSKCQKLCFYFWESLRKSLFTCEEANVVRLALRQTALFVKTVQDSRSVVNESCKPADEKIDECLSSHQNELRFSQRLYCQHRHNTIQVHRNGQHRQRNLTRIALKPSHLILSISY